MEGLLRAARYCYKPNILGYCGSQEKRGQLLLQRFLRKEKVDENAVRDFLATFEAAYPYLQLIASENNIADPFEEKVVEAYWIGNDLLEKVRHTAFQAMIAEKFGRPHLLGEKRAREIAQNLPPSLSPHHSVHLSVIGSLTKKLEITVRNMDFCRIGWGKVEKKEEEILVLTSQRLVQNKTTGKLALEEEKGKVTLYSPHITAARIGDIVSFHWKCACEVLTNTQVENLQSYTLKTLRAINSAQEKG